MQYTVNSGYLFFLNPFKVLEFSLLKKVPVKKINLKLTHFVTSLSLPTYCIRTFDTLSRLYSIWSGYKLGAHCPCYTLHSIWVYIQYPCGNTVVRWWCVEKHWLDNVMILVYLIHSSPLILIQNNLQWFMFILFLPRA